MPKAPDHAPVIPPAKISMDSMAEKAHCVFTEPMAVRSDRKARVFEKRIGYHHMSDTKGYVITYRNTVNDMDALPKDSVFAMFTRGVRHYYGNEGASAISTKKEAWLKENPGTEEVPESVLMQWVEEEDARRYANLRDGTVGHSSRGPRGTAVDTIARRIAVSELTANLAKSKIKFPTGKETVPLPGSDGSVRHWTRNEMIDYRLAHPVHGPKIKKAAQREFDNLNKAAAGAAEGGNPLDA